ncbi:hypothetical protein Ae201684P_015309 [Aphanomyces euteiches]|nr:hypothetical protein Ae201684P_015309 [Aphanomyces euteiches]
MEYSFQIHPEAVNMSDHIVNDEMNLLWDSTVVPPIAPLPVAAPPPIKLFHEPKVTMIPTIPHTFPKESLEPMAFNPLHVNQILTHFPELHPMDGTFLRSAFENIETLPSNHPPEDSCKRKSLTSTVLLCLSKCYPLSLKTHALLSGPPLELPRRPLVASKLYVKCQTVVDECVPKVFAKLMAVAANVSYRAATNPRKMATIASATAVEKNAAIQDVRKPPSHMVSSSQGGGYCRAHGGGKRCQAPNCTKGAQRGNFCATHGGFRNCQVTGCVRTDRGGGYCEVHRRDKLCTAKGCKKLSKNNGLCTLHLRRSEKEGKRPTPITSTSTSYLLPATMTIGTF